MSEQVIENLGGPARQAIGPLMAAYREMAYRHELFVACLVTGPADFAWRNLRELSRAIANYERVISQIADTFNPEER